MSPGQVWETGQGGDQVEEGPGDDDAVVDVEPEDDGHGGVSHPLQDGDQLSHHGTASSPEILSSSNFLRNRRVRHSSLPDSGPGRILESRRRTSQ